MKFGGEVYLDQTLRGKLSETVHPRGVDELERRGENSRVSNYDYTTRINKKFALESIAVFFALDCITS